MLKKTLFIGSLYTDFGILLLRLSFGLLFTWHGYEKLVSFNEVVNYFPNPLGLGAELSVSLVVFAECFCGIFISLGLFTRLVVVPPFITMFVAFFIIHTKDDFSVKELAFVLLLLSIIIFILGSGKYSLDQLLFNKNK